MEAQCYSKTAEFLGKAFLPHKQTALGGPARPGALELVTSRDPFLPQPFCSTAKSGSSH